MGEPRIAQGAVNGVLSLQGVEQRGVQGAGVDDSGGVQENAVEMVARVGHEGGVDG